MLSRAASQPALLKKLISKACWMGHVAEGLGLFLAWRSELGSRRRGGVYSASERQIPRSQRKHFPTSRLEAWGRVGIVPIVERVGFGDRCQMHSACLCTPDCADLVDFAFAQKGPETRVSVKTWRCTWSELDSDPFAPRMWSRWDCGLDCDAPYKRSRSRQPCALSMRNQDCCPRNCCRVLESMRGLMWR
ncbi:hypothetical protein EJ04DRAFT_267811 [Polyplosphaeria fusca]|uniref:Uncharacterized protein n=1 Tax=Polyplosphaeria fusca TaxID=682080 RepID=A0A9P4QZC9_9PLEO|nr:hypothetical protein EJ04DRAFT_267811 [Polyplosphaeria fusca]